MICRSFSEVESVTPFILVNVNINQWCLFPEHTDSNKTDTQFSPPRKERWELTENIMEQFLWLSMKAMWLWQNRKLLNSQAGSFTWLLFRRSDATSVQASLSHNTSVLVISHTGKWKRTDIWGQLILCLFIHKNKPFFQFPTTDRCSSITGAFIRMHFNKEHAIANGVLQCRTARAVALPGTDLCA